MSCDLVIPKCWPTSHAKELVDCWCHMDDQPWILPQSVLLLAKVVVLRPIIGCYDHHCEKANQKGADLLLLLERTSTHSGQMAEIVDDCFLYAG
jgi:hypothetical protein